MESASQICLKAQKRWIKTTIIGIISLKTTKYVFFENPRDRTWQQFLVSSQPILDFLEPWLSRRYQTLERRRHNDWSEKWISLLLWVIGLHQVSIESSSSVYWAFIEITWWVCWVSFCFLLVNYVLSTACKESLLIDVHHDEVCFVRVSIGTCWKRVPLGQRKL